MCGILGCIDAKGVNKLSFDKALGKLVNRGPDGQGSIYLDNNKVALGHTRLAIIDLSDNASQPMSNEDGSIWMVFNGEIYNYKYLRTILSGKGHKFISLSDSEVILHAYEEWGIDCLNYFDGIFSFAIWNSNNNELFAARDHLGVKPLYYCNYADKFVFSSQPRSIIDFDWFNKQIDINSFANYFSFGYVPNEMSIFNGINKLMPAHYLLFSNGSLVLKKFWEIKYEPIIENYEDAVLEIRKQFIKSVESQLISDVPVGTFLSGGIDSSAVASIAQSVSKYRLKTFNIGFEESWKDESKYANIAANEIGTEHYSTTFRFNDFISAIPDFAEIYDEPFFDSSGFPTYVVSKMAKDNGIKVVLSGDGGDELFAGYKRYYDNKSNFFSYLKKIVNISQSNNSEIDIEDYFTKIGFFNNTEIKNLLLNYNSSEKNLLLYKYLKKLPKIAEMQYIDINTYLPDDILVKVDRASMYCGVEVRVPILDRHLVELSFKIDNQLHHKNNISKSIFKNAVSNLLSEAILSPRKKGFSIPISLWMRNYLQIRLKKFLINGSLVQRNVLNPNYILRVLSSKDYQKMWLLMAAELWARRWIENENGFDLKKYFS